MPIREKGLRYIVVVSASLALGVPLIAQITKTAAPTTAPAAQAARNKVVITAGDQVVTAGEFEDLINSLPAQDQAMARGPAKRMVAQKLVEVKLLSSEARRRQLDQTAHYKQQLALLQDNLLAQELADDVQKHVDQSELKAYFQAHASDFETMKARHILVRSGAPLQGEAKDQKILPDEQAKAKIEQIRQRLLKGEDFATVAKAESDDKGSAAMGGDLGPFKHDHSLVKPFEDAAFALKEGEISQPVKTQFGYHLIQVQQRTSPTFEAAKDEIEARLAPERLDQLIAELKKNNPPKLDDEFFSSVPPTSATPMPAAAAPDKQ